MFRLKVSHPFSIQLLTSAHDYSWDSSFLFTGESHSDWEFVCVLDGEVLVTEDEKVYTLQKGSFICHAPYEFHSIRSSGGTHPHVLVLSFCHDGILPAVLSEGVFFLSPIELEAYTTIFQRVRTMLIHEDEDPYRSAEVAGALESFLILLAQRQTPYVPVTRTKNVDLYQQVVRSMQAAVYQNLTLEAIAQQNAISISTMKNLFRTFTGIPPKAYYSKLRLLEAIRLMDEGWKIGEVAEQLGFPSPNYFSVFFKNIKGETPGEYLKRRHGIPYTKSS